VDGHSSSLDKWSQRLFPDRKQSCIAANRIVWGAWLQSLRGREKMADLNQRVEAMYQSDKRGAWLFVIALWIVVLFVLFMSWPHIPDSGVRAVVAVAALAVLVFNTASIYAMVSHYAEDKEFIYGLDIKHLDLAKQRGDM
jgi:hypothetical protein